MARRRRRSRRARRGTGSRSAGRGRRARSRSRCAARSCRRAGERAVDGGERERARLLRPRLQPRLVDLDDVGARLEQVADLLVDRHREVHRQLGLVVVELVRRLLAHRERAGQGDLDRAVGVAAQEAQVVDLDRPRAADLADDPRHRVRPAGAAGDHRGVVDVEALERGREAVGVALAPDLAVGDDVDAGALLVGDRERGRVVLRLLRGRAPRRATAPARARAAEASRGASRGRSASRAAGSCR